MHYLTNYYRNLCEQLQERLNNLYESDDYKDLLRRKALDRQRSQGVEFRLPVATHDKIVNSLVKYTNPSSEPIIRIVLNNHPDAPFLSPGEAIEAIRPHLNKDESFVKELHSNIVKDIEG